MPFYDYLCHGCGAEFNKRLSMDDRHVPEAEPCPSCEQLEVKIRMMGFTLVSSAKTNLTPPSEFRTLMDGIKANNKGSTMDY